MNRNTAKEILPIIQAIAEGKSIQSRLKCDGAEWENFDNNPTLYNLEYRIRPEPKPRPWKPEEVPVGAVIANQNPHFYKWLIVGLENEHVCISGRSRIPLDELFTHWKYSTDNGATWKPCGVTE